MDNSDNVTTITEDGALLAAIDLGSNSFHMVVAKLFQGELTTVDVMSDKVQLAAGMNGDKMLGEEAIERGLNCLRRFAQRISAIPRSAIKIVGTNALREAHNSSAFATQAEKILGVPLEIIAGREEARLIYLGVSHTLADVAGARLVVDIGGGSTEFIIGERFEPLETESLDMGCVSFTQRFFNDGKMNATNFRRAEFAAKQELLSIRERYRQVGWSSSVGASGSIKAIRNACVECGFTDNEEITPKSLAKLKDKFLSFDTVSDLDIPGIKQERLAILPAGLAILTALFESLGVKSMGFSTGALREGLLYDMAGRLQHEDVRERSISALCQRYHVDLTHAQRVEHTAMILLAQVKSAWELDSPEYHDLLAWAARTHEAGLTIAHSQFHKHSAYLVQHSDLAGFTSSEQQLLGFLVRAHRRKFPKDEYKLLPDNRQEAMKRLCVLLRLGVILNRSRDDVRLPALSLQVDDKDMQLTFPEGWFPQHPLTEADLEQEQDYLKHIDINLSVS